MTAAPAPRWTDAAGYFLAIGIATFASAVDLHNDEPQAAALVLIVGGFLMGMLLPRGAWRWMLILGASIIAGEFLAPRFHLIAHDAEPINWGALVALIPAAIGTYVGVGVRALINAGVKEL